MGMLDKMRRRKDPGPPARTVVGAALPLSGPGVRRLDKMRTSLGVQAWQKDAWYYYDAVGELRAPFNRIALALSQAEPYAATVDPDTGEAAGRSEDPRAQAAARMMLGGAKQRAGLLYLFAIMWQVGGEAYIVVRPSRRAGQPDEWLILTGSRITERGGNWTYTDPYTGEMITLRVGTDLLFRVHSPHPEDQTKADSAVRAAIPILAEIEKASQNIAARLDSRLASNGVYWIPSEVDFPLGDHDSQGEAFTAYLMRLMEASMAAPGTAAAQVPIVGVVPGELIAQIRHDDLSTEFDQSVVELRNNGRDRLASALDMPKTTAAGDEGEANHWSAWQIEETLFKVFVVPLLEALSDAVSQNWYRMTLIAMGVSEEEADRTILAWDTAMIVARPDQTEDMKWAWDNVLISDEVMLDSLGMSEDDKPDEEEYRRRTLTKLVAVAPTLLSDPNVAEGMDLFEIEPEAAGVAPAPEPAQIEAGGNGGNGERNIPDTRDNVPEGLTAAAEVLVKQALSRAGGRLLTNQNRGQFKHVDRHELYQHIRPDDLTGLVEIEFAGDVAETFGMQPAHLAGSLAMYVGRLLTTGEAYDRNTMRWYLR